MAQKDDLIFGDIAIRSKMVSQEQIAECVKFQRNLKEWRALGQILLEKNYITPAQHQTLVDLQKRSIETKAIKARRLKEDNIFGKIAMRLGFASEKHVDECLGVQLEMADDYPLRLGEIMVKKGFLTEENVQKISEFQGHHLITCPKCGHSYNVILFNPGVKFICYSCDKELTTNQ
ncbi:MAG: hypothetical protein WC980_00350 [Candidatus Brocadiia bacterium]